MDQTTIQEIIGIWKIKTGSITKFGEFDNLLLKMVRTKRELVLLLEDPGNS